MRLEELLDKFVSKGFSITVYGWCNEMPFYEYENEKKKDYWEKYKDKKVINMAILTTNGEPELCINVE